jgi:hypothetical protein
LALAQAAQLGSDTGRGLAIGIDRIGQDDVDRAFSIIFVGRLGAVLEAQQLWRKASVLLLLGWAVISYLSVHPHSLAYFNELAGGPDKGHRHLLGSNIDWGQDLFRLKRWMEEHPDAAPVKVAYFNHIDPRIVGLDFELPPFGLRMVLRPPGKRRWDSVRIPDTLP